MAIEELCPEGPSWRVPNPPFADPGVAEKAPSRSLQSGVTVVYSLLEIPTDSYHFPSHLTPSSDPNRHFARKVLSATLGLAPGGLGTRQPRNEHFQCFAPGLKFSSDQSLRRTVLGSSRAPCYQRDLCSLSVIFC